MTGIPLQEAVRWAEAQRAAGKRIVSTNGCFDLLHAGHLATLTRARALGDTLIVLVNSDSSARRLKGPGRPFVEENDRVAMLSALRVVDRVVVFEGDTPLPELAAIRPGIHVKGGSFEPDRVREETALLEQWGGRVEVLPLVPGISTTRLAQRIRERLAASIPLRHGHGEAARARLDGSRYPRVDRGLVQTAPFSERANLVSVGDFAGVPRGGVTNAFLHSLPTTQHRTNAADNLVQVVQALRSARERGRTISWACGPHLVKHGLTRQLLALMRRGFVSQVATNGAGAIHDVEIALFGATSEEMSGRIHSGAFGMARETGEFINQSAREAWDRGAGLGETLGRRLLALRAPHAADSLLAQAYRLEIPATVHVAIGTDIVHMHPGFDGAATGAASGCDFDIFAAGLDRLGRGGVHVNVASSVVLPEVFLKSLTLVNNLRRAAGKTPVRDFLTVAMDHQSEYRPLMNVVRRPTQDMGKGVELLGRIEILIPLLAGLLLDEAGESA